MKRENYYNEHERHDPATDQQEAYSEKSGTRAHTLYGTCYWILFWIFIPFLVSNALQSDAFGESFRGINIAGQILAVASILLYGIILIILSDLQPQYAKAGTFLIVISVLNATAAVLMNKTDSDTYSLNSALITFVSYILFLGASGFEFQAHAMVMSNVDEKLSRKWQNFKIWFIILFLVAPFGAIVMAVVFAAILSFMIFILIGIMLCLASILAVFILKFRYMYLTAYVYTQDRIRSK